MSEQCSHLYHIPGPDGVVVIATKQYTACKDNIAIIFTHVRVRIVGAS